MKPKIGIRREDKSEWEKRAPLVPDDVEYLLNTHSIKTIIQPSPIRIFPEEEYKKVGAKVKEKLDVPIILGIKEIPVDFFEKDKIYLFFSHTIKGQEYNMPMLKKMMEKGDTLIDYECITDENGTRLIAFSKFAGIAGMIESLWAAGRRLQWEGYSTPLNKIKRVIEIPTIKDLEKQTIKVGKEIKSKGFPEELTPFVVGIAGYGKVSKGAQEVLNLFPTKEIEPEDLFIIKDNPHTIYKVVFKEKDIAQRKDGGKFSLKEFYNNPELYKGIFRRYLPYIVVLVNAIYWEEKYPRLITKEWLKKEYNPNSDKIRIIGDISCDIEGSIECTVESTEPGNPVYVYDPVKEGIKFGVKGDYPAIMAVDILPSEVPTESSIYFSNILKTFVPEIVKASYPEDFEKCSLPEYIKKAVILYKGKLTRRYQYLKQFLKED